MRTIAACTNSAEGDGAGPRSPKGRTRRHGCASIAAVLAALASACGSSSPEPAAERTLETQCGAALAEMRMPFEFQMPADSGVNQIRVRTEGGGYRNLTFGPWGAHASPHTGHTEGNGKADMFAPYSTTYADLTYLPDPGMECTPANFAVGDAVQCGLSEAQVLADRFGYTVPGDGYEVLAVYKEFELDVATSFYAFDTPQWKVSIRRQVGECNLAYSFGHVAWLGPALIEALEARGIDWQNAPVGENLSDDENPITLAAGDVIAYPQIAGRPTNLAAGYVVPHDDSPSLWTQIEFVVNAEFQNAQRTWEAYSVPVYRGLDADDYGVWSEIFVQNALDPANPRYGAIGSLERQWLWAAEGDLMLSRGFRVDDAGSLTAALGAWWEGDAACATDATLCDEMVTFFPIYRDTALFAGVAAGYDPNTRYVVGKVWGGDQSRTFGEVLAIYDYVETDAAYVTVSSLDETRRGALVLRQRTELAPKGTPFEDTILGYQTVSYDLDPVEGRLVLAWGALRDSEAAAIDDVPDAPPTQADACTGESHVEGSTTCHHKQWRNGWVSPANVYP